MNSNGNGPTSLIRLGGVEVSRFIFGHNPPCGNSHVSKEMNEDFKSFYRDEKVLEEWFRAEAAGVRTFLIRGDFWMLKMVELYRRRGGTMNVVCQTASEMHDVFRNIRMCAGAGCDAIYHHGTQTDKFWREGRIDDTVAYLQTMRDCGVAVGLASHQPEIIEYAEQAGWDLDFYMTCFYNISRSPRESMLVTGKPSYDVEVYLDEDRAAMVKAIQSVSRPCLAFKVLAASRNCQTQTEVREAFRYAYANIKPTDGVVVGLFSKYVDQLTLDLGYAEEACAAAAV
jgi:hypothetical protein